MTAGMRTVLRSAAAALRWPERHPVYDWARRNIVLTPRQATAFPGPYAVDVFPPLRGIFDALQDPAIHSVAVCKAAQTGLTTAAYVWVCYLCAEEPGPVLIVMPSENLARSASETRLQPMFEDSARMRAEMVDDPDAFQKLQYRLRRCQVNWVGSNSPANLASRPVRYLVLDEVDKYPSESGGEGSAIDLAIERTKTFWNRKVFTMSTPTVEGGNIWRAYEDGDRRSCFLPCHACGHMQRLEWGRVRFDATLPPSEAAAGAAYHCVACDAKWTDTDKIAALRKHEWRSTAQAKYAGAVSFHLPSLYAPWVSWSGLVAKFLAAKDHPDRLHNFVNSELAETWKPETTRAEDDAIRDRAMPYTRGELFAAANCMGDAYRNAQTMVALSVDVQKDHLWWVARQWAMGGDSGLLDYGRIDGYGFDEIAKLADRYPAAWVMVDVAYDERALETLEACVRFRFTPCRGATQQRMTMPWYQTVLNIYEGTRRQQEGVSVVQVTHDSAALKWQLMDRIRGVSPFRWYVTRDVTDEYVGQVTAEEFANGKWVKRRGHRDNHLLDCEVLQILAATVSGYNTRLL